MDEMNNTFLQIKNLQKIYPNGEQAVYDFNLDIAKNEFIVIVGPSGCGKSTTLRMVAGLEDISAGEVWMDGELLNYKPCKDRKMAIVFQSYALYPQMTVYENIAFPLTINKYPCRVVNERLLSVKIIADMLVSLSAKSDGYQIIMNAVAECKNAKCNDKKRKEKLSMMLGIPLEAATILLDCPNNLSKEQFVVYLMELKQAEETAVAQKGITLNDDYEQVDENGEVVVENRQMTDFEIREKVFSTAKVLDLVQYLDKIPKELSGGQMQRVALGRAIVKNVPVFMMDEPLSNLDAKLRLVMRSEIVQIHNNINATTLYVTHDQTEAMTMATRIVVMSRGFVQQIGTPEEVYNNPVNIFVARFIGSPSMNVFELVYDKASQKLVGNGVEIAVGKKFDKRYTEFYQTKQREFVDILDNFDDEAQKYIRKVISATDQQGEKMPKAEQKKPNLFARLFSKLFGKKQEEQTESKELVVAREKAIQLDSFAKGGQKLFVGIRPERISICKHQEGKEYPNGTVLKPILCELLGAEYNVHFNYCGQNMVGKIDAKEKITPNDKIVVQLSFDDIYVFDPVTGEVI